jgi:hypothetical protein
MKMSMRVDWEEGLGHVLMSQFIVSKVFPPSVADANSEIQRGKF